MTSFSESVAESAAPAWLEGVGWNTAHGSDICAPSIVYNRPYTCSRECINAELRTPARLDRRRG